jgi:hypothetical protein
LYEPKFLNLVSQLLELILMSIHAESY